MCNWVHLPVSHSTHRGMWPVRVIKIEALGFFGYFGVDDSWKTGKKTIQYESVNELSLLANKPNKPNTLPQCGKWPLTEMLSHCCPATKGISKGLLQVSLKCTFLPTNHFSLAQYLLNVMFLGAFCVIRHIVWAIEKLRKTRYYVLFLECCSKSFLLPDKCILNNLVNILLGCDE